LWTVRDFAERDLDQAVRVWDESQTTSVAPAFTISEVVAALRAGEPAVVASTQDNIIGTCIGRIVGERAWILRLGISPNWRRRGIGSELLAALDRLFVRAGVQRVTALLPEGETGEEAFSHRGFTARNVKLFEKLEPLRVADADALHALGGQILPPDGWDRLAGMAKEKDLIEKRVVLPLAKPEIATKHGVVPPSAVVLFGPPGTGKTSFAKGVAARLGWPFIELFPSVLANEGQAHQAQALHDAFERVTELDRLVLFIDEVDEIASQRAGRPETQGVVNELLKTIPRFREKPSHLLVCATNSVRALDPALIRPGRFDYVLPVGPPDEVARKEMWRRQVAAITTAEIDLDLLVNASALFTPADIGYAAQRAAQTSFERALKQGSDAPADIADFLAAVSSTRASVTKAMLRDFEEDIDTYARY
jgi:SpoVK/Ycf46/Vps4 family AAA+-type ATPase